MIFQLRERIARFLRRVAIRMFCWGRELDRNPEYCSGGMLCVDEDGDVFLPCILKDKHAGPHAHGFEGGGAMTWPRTVVLDRLTEVGGAQTRAEMMKRL